MNPTKIDITPDRREKLTAILNARLIDIIDLTLQAKQAHWNVKGQNFIALHKLFDEVYESMADLTDDVAERLVALGGFADGSVQTAARKTTLPHYPQGISASRAHVEALSTALATFGKAVRHDIDRANELSDADTADLFTQVSRTVDKYLWFVESHLQND
jgi:starvation-inducible DNA-binding protein